MKNQDHLTQRLQNLFRERMNLVVASPDSDLFEEGILDSLALVDLLMFVEQEFQTKIELQELDLDTFRTLRSMATFLARRHS